MTMIKLMTTVNHYPVNQRAFNAYAMMSWL